MAQSIELLGKYYESGDEEAFRELVRLELDLVYSTAFRQLGDPELAKDVSQVVFADLAKRAGSLCGGTGLSGWLYHHTCFVAAKVRRTEGRRRVREQKAMQSHDQTSTEALEVHEIVAVLDWAMRRLTPGEREVLVLRFFRGQALGEVGRALGVSENAARMRVGRALQGLRRILAKRGVTGSTAALAAVLASVTIPAPASMAAMVASSALAATANASVLGTGIFHALNFMNTTKVVAGVAVVAMASAITAPVLMQNQIDRLRSENSIMKREAAQLAGLRVENDRLSKVKVDAEELSRLRLEQGELLRLRGEVGLLRHRLRDVETAKTKASASAEPAQASQDMVPGFYDAESWTNRGWTSPQSSAMTLLWSLRTGHAQEYSESLGKTNIVPLPLDWANALNSITGSQISQTLTSEEGQPMVGILHELNDGSTESTWLTFTNVNGEWLIRSLTGYPIILYQSKMDSGR